MSPLNIDQNPKAELDQYLRYRMFASVDVSGSTAFKHSQKLTWIKVFEQFFEDFPARVLEAWEQLPKTGRGRPAKAFQVWKYVGDEILFVADLCRHEEALWHAYTLLSAVAKYEPEELQQKHEQLGLKVAMWTAGFPVANSEVQLRLDATSDDRIDDYLGPDIDLGFRLAGFADQRRVPVNLQLVYLLQRAKSSLSQKTDYHPCICYSGAEVLKGVNSNKSYPIFWIDRNRGEQTAEDRLLGREHKLDAEDINSYINDFVAKNSTYVAFPFIVSDEDEEFSKVPEDVYDQLASMISGDPDRSYRRSEDEDAGGSEEADLPSINIPRTKKRLKK